MNKYLVAALITTAVYAAPDAVGAAAASAQNTIVLTAPSKPSGAPSGKAATVVHTGCTQTLAEQCAMAHSDQARKKCFDTHPNNLSDACMAAQAQKPLPGGHKHLGDERPTATALAGNNQIPTPLQAPLQQMPNANLGQPNQAQTNKRK